MTGDAELVTKARRGDVRSYGALVERYKERAYMIALGFVGSPEDAMDLSQEAFVKAFRSLRTFREGQAFYPWFYAILRNTCFNHLRRTRTRRETSLEAARETGFDVPDGGPGPAESAERGEMRALVRFELDRLDPVHKEILLLRHFEELSYKEIAAVLGCPLGTVMSRLYAARRALRARMAKYFEEARPSATAAGPAGAGADDDDGEEVGRR